MARCESCDVPLEGQEIITTLWDGRSNTYTYYETLCGKCLSLYVYNVHTLDSKEYAYEGVTEVFSQYKSNLPDSDED